MTTARDASRLLSPDRLSALDRASLLDSEPEGCFDRITALVKTVLGCDVALLSLVATDRQFFKSQCGLPEPYATTRETPLSHSFCQYVVETSEPLVVPDARQVAELAANAAVADLGVISYLGAPVRSPAGETLGALCAIGTTPRAWSGSEVKLMVDFARVVEDEIAFREVGRNAVNLAELNALLAHEYHHRVKNALTVSAALLKLSAKDATSVEDLVEQAGARLTALAGAHDSLIVHSDDVDLQELAARLLQPYCVPGANADVSGPSLKLRNHQVTPICLFLHELATNSAKYGAFRDFGRVSVRWQQTPQGRIVLDWNEELTGGTQRAPSGFGSKLLESSARQLAGTCQTSWSEDGLSVTLNFPLLS